MSISPLAINVENGERSRALVVSPHLDDAVFGCGRLLAMFPGSTVATVFAGRPPSPFPLTEWDSAAGFHPGDDVVGARREEDRHALAHLAAEPVWCDFCDSQYHCPATLEQVREELAQLLMRLAPRSVFIPLGLFHADHRLTHEAARALVAEFPNLDWYAYEDVAYRRIPGVLEARIQELQQQGYPLRHYVFLGDHLAITLKQEAVAYYRSQCRAMVCSGRLGLQDTLAPEGYWRLHDHA